MEGDNSRVDIGSLFPVHYRANLLVRPLDSTIGSGGPKTWGTLRHKGLPGPDVKEMLCSTSHPRAGTQEGLKSAGGLRNRHRGTNQC